MEEREALKRQIELLQNLINKHKSIHGDAPFTGTEQSHPEASTSTRGRGQSTSVIHPQSSRGHLHYSQSRGSWKKTYSLRNKNPQSSVGHPSASTSSFSVRQSASQSTTHSISLPSHSRGKESDATSSSEIAQQKKKEHIDSKNIDSLRKLGATVSQEENEKRASSSTGSSVEHKALLKNCQEFQQRTESRHVVLPGKNVGYSSEVPKSATVNTSTSLQSTSKVQVQPSLTSKTTTATKQTINTAAPAVATAVNSTPALSALSRVVKPLSLNPSSQNSQAQISTSFLKKSKFTWVKSQAIPSMASKAVAPASVLKAGVASGSPSVSKRTPAKKMARKLSPVSVAQKTSKYKWVSSAGAPAKTPRKSLSPKTLSPAQTILEKGDTSKRLKPYAFPSTKLKKGTAGCSTSSPHSSRYRWKAGGQSASVVLTEGATVARRRSAFHWTAEKTNKGLKAGLVVSPTFPQRASSSSSPGGFKLRSRMKIIRKSASSGSGSERGSGPSPLKFSPRGRIHTFTRSPMGVKRTPSRELVSFGRHKLRRLSPTISRTNPTASFHRSPASQRVFRTHYKMVTRPGFSAMHTLHYNPALSWRTKRIQSARNFLQSRLRTPHDRHPSSTQQWRGSGMCWIGGSLYRVSANKLSRSANMSINRTGQFFSSQGSHMTPALTRPSSTRHLASRAVQRSLAIIRHARQKKQQKQYCMYYNRFGKCNRGTNCPYIHDPDKVAVCTRFLRGTCKQTDGVCPFSHKVAKEKMPVCSYFLKGICNNSDCPYSHVYVSRNAEVCEDFVRGYCPAGEKCKKKHTLVCPDFSKTGSCPRGSRCKLQHRQRVKRSASNTSTTPAKKTRPKEPLKRPCLSVVMPRDPQTAPGTPTLALPSFISLSSSPEEADAPDTPPADTSQVKGRNMQNSTKIELFRVTSAQRNVHYMS